MGKYWENEKPVVVKSGNMEIEHYPKEGVLQICFYRFNEQGEIEAAKRLSFRKEVLKKYPRVLNLLAEVFKAWQEEQ